MPVAELVLETPRFVVRIRIRGTKCRLLGPDVPELRHLLGETSPELGAGHLIMELERAGICLSPSDDDAAKAIAPSTLATLAASGGTVRGEQGYGHDGEEEDGHVTGVVLKER